MYSVEHVKWQARLVLVGAVSLLSLFRLSDAVASGPNTPLEGNGLSAVKLDEENFPLLVNGDNSAIVLFAAPWCYHSQKVYPEFAKLASTYSLKDGVLVAHVKADEEKSIMKKYEVNGFPAIKWFQGGQLVDTGVSYTGGRTAEDMVEFVNSRLGLDKKLKSPPEHTESLTPNSFDSFSLDPNRGVLVYFYAAWSDFSKEMLTNFEIAAYSYRSDKSVVLAKMDVEKYPEFALKYSVTTYPTILYFSKGEDAAVPILYNEGFGVQNYLDYLNDLNGLHRMSGGDILDHAGLTTELKDEAARFMDHIFSDDASSAAESLKKFEAFAEDESETGSSKDDENSALWDYFAHVAESTVKNGKKWPSSELERLLELINSDAVSHVKKSEFMLKRNVLKCFQ
mgnify:FL=1|jgi:protein disulfide-isomerase A6